MFKYMNCLTFKMYELLYVEMKNCLTLKIRFFSCVFSDFCCAVMYYLMLSVITHQANFVSFTCRFMRLGCWISR